MKKKSNTYLLCILSAIFYYLLSNISLAQLSPREITLIKLAENIGYIIDATENEQCNCIPYVDMKNFSYAALIQLPDSSIVLKIKLINSPDFRTIHLIEHDVEKLHLSATTIIKPISTNDSTKEKEWLKKLSGDTMAIKYIDYNRLRFPDFLKNENNDGFSKPYSKRNVFFYINGGLGLGIDSKRSSKNSSSYYSLGIEIGIITKKNLLSFRSFGIIEIPPLIAFGEEPLESLRDFGLLYGRILHFNGIILSASLGLSLTMGVIREEVIYDPITMTWSGSGPYGTDFNTIGLPIQAEILFGARHNFDLGLNIFGNINQKYSFGGILICLRFGAVNAKNKD
ncbi:MAG: hypothetical protein NTZ33_10660 [Bacteroidetes bacterium]|nr:hypothetical protein [Bacteroidota bacterium]